MNACLPLTEDRSASLEIRSAREEPVSVRCAVATACGRIAPLWPLEHFVAVNPFLGLTEQSFDTACATLQRVAGCRTVMPRSFYRDLIARGAITDSDIATALASNPPALAPRSIAAVKTATAAEAAQQSVTALTFVELVDRDCGTSHGSLVVDEISKWCAAYFDRHQSFWRAPWQGMPLYAAWRNAARFDRTAELTGCAGFRAAVLSLPDDPVTTVEHVLEKLRVPGAALDDYLHRALLSVNGWAAYAAQQRFSARVRGADDDTVVHLLAIRLAWEYGVHRALANEALERAWDDELMRMAARAAERPDDADLALRLLLQRAYDYAAERELLGRLDRPAGATDASTSRKTLQAAFCIDVRSEIYRRALEAQSDAIGTLGFAGFFGLAFEYVPLGHDEGRPHCPVLLEPGTVIRETIADRSDATHAASQRRGIHDRLTRLWRTFRSSAVSSFVYVETLGFASAGKLLGSLLGRTRPVADPRTRGLKRSEADALRPSLVPIEDVPRPNGLEPQARVDAAAQLLGGMSLTRDFARIVLLVGHGSSTVNNPHGAGLDCGACGGHSGESNAQLAAALLNDIDVRAGLRERGIAIPSDTWFIAGLHDTTTDAVTLYDLDRVPAELASDVEKVSQWLRGASHQARLERAARLGLAADASAEARIAARSRDWSQVRPEWGLAGCSAFIAAPRSRTAGVDLGGRAFLHEYDWQSDPDLGVLELIMSAPMVVASWINLQYYGSVVDNDAFGSGNKVLHNVVAGLGVLEGNAGDLRVGLPWQSIHDGREYAHEPRRLTVCLAAPVAAINRVIARNAEVRKLVDNGWVHVLAMPLEGGEWHRYRGGLQWDVLTAHASSAETPLGTAATAAAPQITA